MKISTLKNLMVVGAVFGIIGCGSSSSVDGIVEDAVSSVSDEAVLPDDPTSQLPADVVLPDDPTSQLPDDVQAIIDGPVSKISQELINTLAYMGNEERLAYDVYNALYVTYPKKIFTNIATNGEYQHITLVQELIQKYKLSDDVNFTNVEVPLGYMNTAIEDMEPGVYDVSEIQDLYDELMDMATNETEALKVGCMIEVIDIMDLDHDIVLAEAEGAADIIEVFKILRAGSYNHYWAFDGALQDGCCPTALEILGGTTCPDYPQK